VTSNPIFPKAFGAEAATRHMRDFQQQRV